MWLTQNYSILNDFSPGAGFKELSDEQLSEPENKMQSLVIVEIVFRVEAFMN